MWKFPSVVRGRVGEGIMEVERGLLDEEQMMRGE